jgi:hypothetical protein
MSFAQLKEFIFSIKDLHFLSIVSHVDFYSKMISIKRKYWNLIISTILDIVEVNSRRQMRMLVSRLKEVLILRLSKVSSTSFKKYFLRSIHYSFRDFERDFLNAYFADLPPHDLDDEEPQVQDTVVSDSNEEPIDLPEEEALFVEDELDYPSDSEVGTEDNSDQGLLDPYQQLQTMDYDTDNSQVEEMLAPTYTAEEFQNFAEEQLNSVPQDLGITNPLEAYRFNVSGSGSTSTFTPGQTFE